MRRFLAMFFAAAMLVSLTGTVYAGPPAPENGIRIPTPTPQVARHMTFALQVREGGRNGHDVHSMTDEIAGGLVCTSLREEFNPSQPRKTEWIGVPAPVVKVRGVWYVSVRSDYDFALYCSGGLQTFEPIIIEDHDSGLLGSGDVIILPTVSVETIYLDAATNGVEIAACGYIDGSSEYFCAHLPIETGDVQVTPYTRPEPVKMVNRPGWAHSLMMYATMGE